MGEVVEGWLIHQFAQRFSGTLIVHCYCLTPSSSCVEKRRSIWQFHFSAVLLPLRGPAWPSNPRRLLSSAYSVSKSQPGLQNHADWKLGGSARLLDSHVSTGSLWTPREPLYHPVHSHPLTVHGRPTGKSPLVPSVFQEHIFFFITLVGGCS